MIKNVRHKSHKSAQFSLASPKWSRENSKTIFSLHFSFLLVPAALEIPALTSSSKGENT